MKRICVFCGSSPGNRPEYMKAANELGNVLVREKIGLVYGGSDVGLMGRIARAVFEQGGEVIGVIPEALAKKEVAYRELSDLRVVGSMHERKALMADLSDAFVSLPGGLGTIEEFFEVLTWAQLGIHNKPCGFLNINGYFDLLIRFLEQAIDHGFINREHKSLFMVDTDSEGLLEQIKTYTPAKVDKVRWILSLKNS